MTRTSGLWTAAIFVLAAAVVGASLFLGPGAAEGPRPTPLAGQPPRTTGGVLEVPEGEPVRPFEDAAVKPTGTPTPRPSAATRQPAIVAPSGASAPTRPIPQDPEAAGEQVSYTDDAGDAHGYDPTSTLNQPAYDIIRV